MTQCNDLAVIFLLTLQMKQGAAELRHLIQILTPLKKVLPPHISTGYTGAAPPQLAAAAPRAGAGTPRSCSGGP